MNMDIVRQDPVDYDAISDKVRDFCAQRLHELEKSLRPLVDGSFGEVLPGHLAGYLATVRELGRLYQVHKRPAHLDGIPMAKVQELVAGMERQHALELATAVQEAEERVRQELNAGVKLSIEGAKQTVLTRLLALESRR